MREVSLHRILSVFVLLFCFGCNNQGFVFLGEAEGRDENFNSDIEVTKNNIRKLYQKYDVFSLFDGDYYLVKSKKSYTNSRYLSRLIILRDGKQDRAQTFYDYNLEISNILLIDSIIVVGLNSLKDNYYNPSSRTCKVIVLNKDLSPIAGKLFSSIKGHTYIESLLLRSDTTLFCSVASKGRADLSFSQYQFIAQTDLGIMDSIIVVKSDDYQIVVTSMDLSKQEWSNDLSKEEVLMLKKRDANDEIGSSNDSAQKYFIEIDAFTNLTVKNNVSNNSGVKRCQHPQIPSDFVLVPGGRLTYKGYYDQEKSVDVDSFYICRFELTQGEYKKIMGGMKKTNYSWLFRNSWDRNVGPKYMEVMGDSIPVRGCYMDFVQYCNVRSAQEGYDGFYEIDGNSIRINPNGNGYRLITPYEWIFAAYGGTIDRKDKFLGGESLSEVAWHLGNSNNTIHPVGLKKPNVLDLYDMQGNAPEILQGDMSCKYYCSMVGGYNVSNWNYSQAYDPTYIRGFIEDSGTIWSYGTRIAFIPQNISNNNLERTYHY